VRTSYLTCPITPERHSVTGPRPAAPAAWRHGQHTLRLGSTRSPVIPRVRSAPRPRHGLRGRTCSASIHPRKSQSLVVMGVGRPLGPVHGLRYDPSHRPRLSTRPDNREHADRGAEAMPAPHRESGVVLRPGALVTPVADSLAAARGRRAACLHELCGSRTAATGPICAHHPECLPCRRRRAVFRPFSVIPRPPRLTVAAWSLPDRAAWRHGLPVHRRRGPVHGGRRPPAGPRTRRRTSSGMRLPRYGPPFEALVDEGGVPSGRPSDTYLAGGPPAVRRPVAWLTLGPVLISRSGTTPGPWMPSTAPRTCACVPRGPARPPRAYSRPPRPSGLHLLAVR